MTRKLQLNLKNSIHNDIDELLAKIFLKKSEKISKKDLVTVAIDCFLDLDFDEQIELLSKARLI